jgi:RND family efflux transporter MFP subunit
MSVRLKPWSMDMAGLQMVGAARRLGCAWVCVAALMACSGGQQGGHGGPGGPGGPPQVSVVPALQRSVQEHDEFSARLEAPDTVDLRARVAGTLEAVHFKEGQSVKKGDLLFSLDARPYQAELARAQAQWAAARSQAELARSELARAEPLLKQQAVSQQELDQLRASLRNSEAQAKAAQAAVQQAELSVSFTRITAPVSGRTSRAAVSPGNLVAVGEPVLTTLVSTDRVYAYFDASEALFLKYGKAARDGTRASNRDVAGPVRMGLSNEEGFPHEGRMDFIDNRVNQATATVRGRAVFDNKEGVFTPGLTARLQIAGSGSFDATLVPDRAITTDQTRKLVLVVGDKNIVQPRPVVPGILVDGMRVVQGVKAGELVIVDGLLRAFPGAPVTPQTLKQDAKGLPLPPEAPGTQSP